MTHKNFTVRKRDGAALLKGSEYREQRSKRVHSSCGEKTHAPERGLLWVVMDGFVVILLCIIAVCSLIGLSWHMMDMFYPIALCSTAAILFICFEFGKLVSRRKTSFVCHCGKIFDTPTDIQLHQEEAHEQN